MSQISHNVIAGIVSAIFVATSLAILFNADAVATRVGPWGFGRSRSGRRGLFSKSGVIYGAVVVLIVSSGLLIAAILGVFA